MSINLAVEVCKTHSNRKLFGLCDDPHPAKNPAYIDESDGSKWIAVVVNEDRNHVIFTAIDNCIAVSREDGTMDKRCDGVLIYDRVIIFIELKERGALGNSWVKDAEKQIRTTIGNFGDSDEAGEYTTKKAYIANSEHPKFKESQIRRMEQFLNDTGYVLRIENRIIL
ncbi:hypothetical protein [Runella sp.]|jgi:hypothetical protein|uniref:hypothetical protein n=1 Tax=Runella sp. TaxID=1960881 RepID=UPI002609561A|nr:hypothetical protein [Runella sp.]